MTAKHAFLECRSVQVAELCRLLSHNSIVGVCGRFGVGKQLIVDAALEVLKARHQVTVRYPTNDSGGWLEITLPALFDSMKDGDELGLRAVTVHIGQVVPQQLVDSLERVQLMPAQRLIILSDVSLNEPFWLGKRSVIGPLSPPDALKVAYALTSQEGRDPLPSAQSISEQSSGFFLELTELTGGTDRTELASLLRGRLSPELQDILARLDVIQWPVPITAIDSLLGVSRQNVSELARHFLCSVYGDLLTVNRSIQLPPSQNQVATFLAATDGLSHFAADRIFWLMGQDKEEAAAEFDNLLTNEAVPAVVFERLWPSLLTSAIKTNRRLLFCATRSGHQQFMSLAAELPVPAESEERLARCAAICFVGRFPIAQQELLTLANDPDDAVRCVARLLYSSEVVRWGRSADGITALTKWLAQEPMSELEGALAVAYGCEGQRIECLSVIEGLVAESRSPSLINSALCTEALLRLGELRQAELIADRAARSLQLQEAGHASPNPLLPQRLLMLTAFGEPLWRARWLVATARVATERGSLNQAKGQLALLPGAAYLTSIDKFHSEFAALRLAGVVVPSPELSVDARRLHEMALANSNPELIAWANVADLSTQILSVAVPKLASSAESGQPTPAVAGMVAAIRGAALPEGLSEEAQVKLSAAGRLIYAVGRCRAGVISSPNESSRAATLRGIEDARIHGWRILELDLEMVLTELYWSAKDWKLARECGERIRGLVAEIDSPRYRRAAEWFQCAVDKSWTTVDLLRFESGSPQSPLAARRAAYMLSKAVDMSTYDKTVCDLLYGTHPVLLAKSGTGPRRYVLAQESCGLITPDLTLIPLTNTMFSLLSEIAKNTIASKAVLAVQVWDRVNYQPSRDDKRIQVAVHRLRQILGEEHDFLRTTEGGYQLAEGVCLWLCGLPTTTNQGLVPS